MDICAFGLRSLRHDKGRLIESRVKNGLKIRILAPHPESIFLKQREKDELVSEGSMRDSITQLIKWLEHLKSIAPNDEDVSIKLYDTLPLDFYFRQDDFLYIGPYLFGKDSLQTPSWEYRANTKIFDIYTTYFEELWCNSDFSKVPSEVGWIYSNSFEGERINKELLDRLPIVSKGYSLSTERCEAILKAKNSIFISGIALTCLVDLRDSLASINPSVSITFAFPDVNNEQILKLVLRYWGLSEKNWKTSAQRRDDDIDAIRKKHPNVKVMMLDTLLHASYYAVDYTDHTEFTHITARHYMLNKVGQIQDFSLTERPETELFNRYRDQILMIIESGGKLSNIHDFVQ